MTRRYLWSPPTRLVILGSLILGFACADTGGPSTASPSSTPTEASSSIQLPTSPTPGADTTPLPASPTPPPTAIPSHSPTPQASDTPTHSPSLTPTPAPTPTLATDGDGDGFPEATDCDDSNATVNPQAPEVCDDSDTDEDCDTLINDADPNVAAPLWFPDLDGDGHGDANALGHASCDKPYEETVTSNDDCNDADPRFTLDCSVACDGSPIWHDPSGDGSLQLTNSETYGIDATQQDFSYICVYGNARINMCEAESHIILTGSENTVINAQGIGRNTSGDATIYLSAYSAAAVFLIVDATQGAVVVDLDARYSAVTLGSYGTGDLYVQGVAGTLSISAAAALHLGGSTGLTTYGNLYADCNGNLYISGAISTNGGNSSIGAPVSLDNPPSCP